jgi:hypothetical protein
MERNSGSIGAMTDRQADEAMRVFTRLTDDFIADGYNVCSTMRYNFFSDCLRTNQYSSYSRDQLRYWLIPAACQYQAERATVQFALEGLSQAEQRQNEPMMNWLRMRGVTAGWINAPAQGRVRRLGSSIATVIKWRSFLAGIERYFSPLDSLGRRLMKAFELDAPFLDWFRFQNAVSLARIKKARICLESISPRPAAIVFSSEHHPTGRPVLLASRSLGIPTVLVQHGFLGQEWLHWPILSEKTCVWGEVDRQWYLRRGHCDKRLALTGSDRAFTIEDSQRSSERERWGVGPNERAVVFFAPNLAESYHVRAAAFLGEARSRLGNSLRWFVRLHPKQRGKSFAEKYVGFVRVSSDAPLKDAFAFADLVLHDYSSMAFAEFAGIQTATLALDPPYPPYYRDLTRTQEEINSVAALCRIIMRIRPGYRFEAAPTLSMAAGGKEALDKLGKSIFELVGNTPFR